MIATGAYSATSICDLSAANRLGNPRINYTKMAPVKALPSTKPKTAMEKLKAWVREEYNSDVKFSSNLVCNQLFGFDHQESWISFQALLL